MPQEAELPGDFAGEMADLSLEDMRGLVLRTLGSLTVRLHVAVYTPQQHGRTPFDLVAQRYSKAIADLSLAVARLSEAIATEDAAGTHGQPTASSPQMPVLTGGSAGPDLRIPDAGTESADSHLRIAGPEPEQAKRGLRMAAPIPGSLESDLRMSAQTSPIRRRRGGQPGNTNRLLHGHRRRGPLAANRHDRCLLSQATALCGAVDTANPAPRAAKARAAARRRRLVGQTKESHAA